MAADVLVIWVTICTFTEFATIEKLIERKIYRRRNNVCWGKISYDTCYIE